MARLADGETGQTLVEYVLIMLFIAVALVGALTIFTGIVGGLISSVVGVF